MIDPVTARWVIWGYKNTYHTHNHIHEALFRALKFMGRDVVWVDEGDAPHPIDYHGCIFLTEHQKIANLPRHDDSFYFVHNLYDDEYEFFNGLDAINWGGFVGNSQLPEFRCTEEITPAGFTCDITDTCDYADNWRGLPLFRNLWATDLLPWEVKQNMGSLLRCWNPDSKVINWVGTTNNDHNLELPKFIQACKENGIEFRGIGGFTPGQYKNHPTIQQNAELIRCSYMAPAIGNTRQAAVGYIPCRVFKNISYGMYPPTNLEFANEVLSHRLIVNPDPYQLFLDAREDLPQTLSEVLRTLMKEVAEKHTYVNRINEISEAIRIYQEAR